MFGGFAEVGIDLFMAQDTGRVMGGSNPISVTWAMFRKSYN